MASNKIVIGKIKNENIDKDVQNKLQNSIDYNDKISIIVDLLGLHQSSLDNLTFTFTDSYIDIRWRAVKYSQESESLHKKALQFAKKNDYTAAIASWSDAAEINPMDPDYPFNIGIAQFELKRYQDAAEILSKTIALCPIYYKAYLVLGTTYIKLRKFEFANKHLQKAILFDDSNSLALLNLGVINSILRKYDDGIIFFEKTIKVSQAEPRAYLGLAKIYSTIGNIKKANDYFKKVIEIDVDGHLANYAKRSIVAVSSQTTNSDTTAKAGLKDPEELFSDAYRYYIAGDYKASSDMYKQYLAIKPDDEYIWYALGETLIRINDIDGAIEALRYAIKFHPQKGLYYKELAVAFDRVSKNAKAIAALNKAISLGKSDSVTYCLLGKALLKTNQIEDAIKNLKKAVKLNRNNLLAKYYLAESHIKNNESDIAIDLLSEIGESKIPSPLKEKAKNRYKELQKME